MTYDQPEPYETDNFNTRVRAADGTAKAKTVKPCIKGPAATSGLAAGKVKHQKPVKHRRPSQKGKHFSEGYEPDSHGEMDFLDGPDTLGLSGQEKHFYDLLINDDSESNFI